jgi:hypothetical protein
MSSSPIVLQQAPESGAFSLQIGDSKNIPLPDVKSARIEGAWAIGQHRLVLITTTTKECADTETLLSVTGENTVLKPLGKCEEHFTITSGADQLTARQDNARDPAIWTFLHGSLNGPVPLSVLNARRARGASPAAGADRATNPTVPPAVSRPVGDDVVPAPVGAGPLPGGSRQSPRLF